MIFMFPLQFSERDIRRLVKFDEPFIIIKFRHYFRERNIKDISIGSNTYRDSIQMRPGSFNIGRIRRPPFDDARQLIRIFYRIIYAKLNINSSTL